MKETRKLKIENKILKKQDLENLWKKFAAQYEDSSENKRMFLELSLECVDGSSYLYEGLDNNCFENAGLLDIKKVRQIQMQFFDAETGKKMTGVVKQGDLCEGRLEIRGEKDWVATVFFEVEDLIKSFTPQDNWILKNQKILMNFGFIIVGWGMQNIFNFILPFFLKDDFFNFVKEAGSVNGVMIFLSGNPFLVLSLMGLIFWLQGYIWLEVVFGIKQKITMLWPGIEFDFGPDHEKLEKRRRNALGWLVTIIIVPILINLIT